MVQVSQTDLKMISETSEAPSLPAKGVPCDVWLFDGRCRCGGHPVRNPKRFRVWVDQAPTALKINQKPQLRLNGVYIDPFVDLGMEALVEVRASGVCF